MSSYRLNIHFGEEDLKIIAKAHQKVILVKHTAGDTDTSVSWVSFKPWQLNTIDWDNTFAVYASNSELQSGAVINKLSDKSATSGVQYDFADGVFGSPKIADTSVKQNTYYAKNLSDDYPAVTIGLAQNVVVNGIAFANHPINAVYVPFGQTTAMTPLEQVDVYLLNDILDSTVITHVQSIKLPVVYGENETEHYVTYNGRTGQFFLKS